MNIRLEKLFLENNLSQKDCYEIRQIYDFLPTKKRQNLIDNFDVIVWEITKLQKEIWFEQEVLLWKSLRNIEEKVATMRKRQISKKTEYELSGFKKQI